MKKILIITLIISIVFSGTFFPTSKKAEAAGWPTYDAISAAINKYTQALIGKQVGGTSPLMMGAVWAGRKIIKRTLREVTNSIVKWVNSGFKGNPAFVTNPEKFLLNTADITIGDFLMGSELEFLCDPFKLQIKLALGLQYQPFNEQIACSFTGALGNVTDAMNNFTNGDFIGGGGWDSWLQMTTIPQNNQMGALMIAQGELDARISGNKEIQLAEAGWGNGVMSWKDCVIVDEPWGKKGTNKQDSEDGVFDESVESNRTNTEAYSRGGAKHANSTGKLGAVVYTDEEGNVVGGINQREDCTINTPGSFIMDQMGWAQSSGIREMELANDIDAIMNALANMVIKKGADYFSSKFKKNNNNETTAYDDNMLYLSSLQAELDAQNGITDGGGYYNTDGSVNFSQSFAGKAAAINALDTQIEIERNYISALNNIKGMIDEAKNIFDSSSCSTKTEISNQLTGTTGGLTRNKTALNNNIAAANTNISLLNNAWSAISSSGSNDSGTISSIMAEELNTMQAHPKASVGSYSQPDGTFFKEVKDWISGKITDNKDCVDDISALSGWGIE